MPAPCRNSPPALDMETSLHRQLKAFYAEDDGQVEVPLGDYRIDVVTGDQLVEIQHGSLAAIRDKIAKLCCDHRVLVVKPLIVTKRLVKRKRKGGKVVDRRKSPKRGSVLDLFDELIYFTSCFPHPNLTLEIALVDIEEWRYPGQGKRRRRGKGQFIVEDQHLIEVHARHALSTGEDLYKLLDVSLPEPFHTGHLAEALGVKRQIAQRIAYCLRETGTTSQVGKQGNTLLYEFAKAA